MTRRRFHSTALVSVARRASLRLAVFVLVSACAGGQSGSEGELPAPPCAGSGGLFEGRITRLESGCVTVEIDRVVSAGDGVLDSEGGVLFTRLSTEGDVVTGRLGTVYAYTHVFSVGESVAVLPGPFGDVLELQLLPIGPDGVEVQWGRRTGHVIIDDLAAPDCAERLESLPERPARSQSGSAPTQPPQPEVECGPASAD